MKTLWQNPKNSPFQSTHPRGVRRGRLVNCEKGYFHFNPRTREGCDKALSIMTVTLGDFNPRTREGCDHSLQWRLYRPSNFNPRTREGCDTARAAWRSPTKHFNPRTREGCDKANIPMLVMLGDFNPRTREGCDKSTMPKSWTRRKFQSTHPRGVRLIKFFYESCGTYISIHAPARGATPHGVDVHSVRKNFNPRTREGCDVQSFYLYLNVQYFNPRTREGCDLEDLLDAAGIVWISIHAPARGATDIQYKKNMQGVEFQSTHPRGVRPQ